MTVVTRHPDAAILREAVFDHLEAHEAQNNHLFGVIGNGVRGTYAERDNLWLSASANGEVVGCAIRTPPRALGLSYGATDAAVRALVARAAELHDEFEISGSPAQAAPAADALNAHLEVMQEQGIYRLERVVFPSDIPGEMRPATEWDVELIAEWAAGFEADTQLAHSSSEQELRRKARNVVADRSMVIWEVDGEPVSMAAARGPTPHGIRISWVYTPRDHRRHGYASACVAALSQRELDSGRDFCFLFTEMSNPTSNHIYQTIGYERVGTLNRYAVR